MNNKKWGTVLVYTFCALLTVAAFFAKDFVLYDFQMLPSQYTYQAVEQEAPDQAVTSVWFSFGTNRELQYGTAEGISAEEVALYAKTEETTLAITSEDLSPIREDLMGYLIAAAPPQSLDADGDGVLETVFDFARADFGPHAYELKSRSFGLPEIPFELAFEERKVIQVFFENQLLTDEEIIVISAGGQQTTYRTDRHGWIDGLPIQDIRQGFTAAYSPDGETVYRMYYALEDYNYFSPHFFRAHIPLLIILVLTAIGIVVVYLIRDRLTRRDPAYAIYSRERPGFRPQNGATSPSKFLFIRWIFLIFSFFLWTYVGKIIGQGQALNQVAIPTFSCPFNLDQPLESSCYYLTHLPVLFTRNWEYVMLFLVTLFLLLVLGGRILCGFMCPLGFIQDLFDKLRQALHIRPIVVTDRMNRIIQPLKWIWILLFLGFVFVGGDFCDICPNKVFSTSLGGWWVNYALGGFLTIPLLVGSFCIKRFWCLMCPMGYLLGIFHKFNLFKLKKDCTACTECGACYEACPMRLKNIYTEREKSAVQTVDCLMCGECIQKCPENNALSMTVCGKNIYRSSRKAFVSKYQGVAENLENESEKEESKP